MNVDVCIINILQENCSVFFLEATHLKILINNNIILLLKCQSVSACRHFRHTEFDDVYHRSTAAGLYCA